MNGRAPRRDRPPAWQAATLECPLVAAVAFAAATAGWWWAGFLVGVGLGVARRRVAARVPGLLALVAGWAAAMASQAGGQSLAVADVVAAMALNARGAGWAVVVAALAYAALLGIAGTWTATAARRVVAEVTSEAAIGAPAPAGRSERNVDERRVAMFDDDSDTQFNVVVNDEDQYSIWPIDYDIPEGWRAVGVSGSKQVCLDHIEQVWTDMRPRSLREQLEADPGVSA